MKLDLPEGFLDDVQRTFQLWLGELERTLTTNRTTPEQGAHYVSLADPVHGITAITAPTGVKCSTVANSLKGYGIRETTGTGPATVILRDGGSTNAAEVVPITLAANESARDWFGEQGISLIEGLYVDVISGSVAGAVYLGTGGSR